MDNDLNSAEKQTEKQEVPRTEANERLAQEQASSRKPRSKRDLMLDIYKQANLLPEDVATRQQGGDPMVLKTGIAKLVFHFDIMIHLEIEHLSKAYCVVKAIASSDTTRNLKEEAFGSALRGSLKEEAFGSALRGPKDESNTTSTYVLEIATSRARNRVVLQLVSRLCGVSLDNNGNGE